jgi:hypothetical protein
MKLILFGENKFSNNHANQLLLLLAQLVERETSNRKTKGSSLLSYDFFLIFMKNIFKNINYLLV